MAKNNLKNSGKEKYPNFHKKYFLYTGQ